MNKPRTPRLLVHDVRLLDAGGESAHGWILAQPDGIVEIGTGAAPSVDADARHVDGRGGLLTPGMIDMHTHGCGGGSFDRDTEQITTALAAAERHGVTRTVLSLVTADIGDDERQLAHIAALATEDATAGAIAGVHLEGPFISPARAGAHDPALLRNPEPELVEKLFTASHGRLRYLTIAPELPGALETIRHATGLGIRVGIGHTEADYETCRAAFAAGATILTHAFNAMPSLHHRAPGPVAAAVDDERVMIELINDGVHVQGPVARMLWRLAGHRLVLITDAMSATDMPDGAYKLGGLDVTVRGGVARLAGTDTIAGSTLTLDSAVRNALALGMGRQDAIRAVTRAPALALGHGDDLGRLAPGFAADLVLWDDGMHVQRVWRDAQEVCSDAHDRGIAPTPTETGNGLGDA